MMKHFIFLFLIVISCSKAESQQLSSLAIPQTRISEIKNYIKGKEYNQELAVFINFKIHSGKYRYFIYNLKNNTILQQAVVSHGSGSVIPKSDALKFSNIEGSYQSSLGKYIIGESYIGKFGKAYRLAGLDATNSNAMQRAIVLHSYGCIPDAESKSPACLSLGCPMLSVNALKETAKYIDKSTKPVILYAFY
ncbi:MULTISPECIES: murein L,D-transpeptidase catalytic domain-containing protein [unclassified Chryseobacterium]|uniref:murein L,D-transpeptidase catalytic domain-containing protein n=1 Tax=unclassified Chryseobacterium TaxID=2593645 RepID=UPI000E0B08D3|nr:MULTISPECIES: murein L,D-transpeptidase catalytic domain family protein [unclassified Chryseobacterium]MDQ1857217.1 murein L,D-transpeptidase catalytic domain family protein [Chryseobacterium sp. WLY505]